MTVKTGLAVAAAIAMLIAPTASAAPQSVNGRWLVQDKGGIVQIGPCGASLCGTLVQILAPGKQNAKDEANPNKALRSRPLRGVNLLHGFTASGDQWRGNIYDPRKGKTYKSFLKLNPNGTLSVKGCWGPICQSQTWTRAR